MTSSGHVSDKPGTGYGAASSVDDHYDTVTTCFSQEADRPRYCTVDFFILMTVQYEGRWTQTEGPRQGSNTDVSSGVGGFNRTVDLTGQPNPGLLPLSFSQTSSTERSWC